MSYNNNIYERKLINLGAWGNLATELSSESAERNAIIGKGVVQFANIAGVSNNFVGLAQINGALHIGSGTALTPIGKKMPYSIRYVVATFGSIAPTYTQSGNVISVTATSGHGLLVYGSNLNLVGAMLYLLKSTGSLVSGFYLITAIPSITTITLSSATSQTTSGNLSIINTTAIQVPENIIVSNDMLSVSNYFIIYLEQVYGISNSANSRSSIVYVDGTPSAANTLLSINTASSAVGQRGMYIASRINANTLYINQDSFSVALSANNRNSYVTYSGGNLNLNLSVNFNGANGSSDFVSIERFIVDGV